MDERKRQDPDEQEGRPDDLKLPEERVEDLEPREDDSAEVKGGGWPVKYQGNG